MYIYVSFTQPTQYTHYAIIKVGQNLLNKALLHSRCVYNCNCITSVHHIRNFFIHLLSVYVLYIYILYISTYECVRLGTDRAFPNIDCIAKRERPVCTEALIFIFVSFLSFPMLYNGF